MARRASSGADPLNAMRQGRNEPARDVRCGSSIGQVSLGSEEITRSNSVTVKESGLVESGGRHQA